MQIAIVGRWDQVRPGRGKEAADVVGRWFALMERLQSEGVIASSANYADIQGQGGLGIVHLEDSALFRVLQDAEWVQLTSEMELVLNLRWGLHYQANEEWLPLLEEWGKTATTLA